jgi:hypothetical protein
VSYLRAKHHPAGKEVCCDHADRAHMNRPGESGDSGMRRFDRPSMVASLAASCSAARSLRVLKPNLKWADLRMMIVLSAKVKRLRMTLMCGRTSPGVGCILADWLSHSAASATRP